MILELNKFGTPLRFEDLEPPPLDLTRVREPVGRFQERDEVPPGGTRLWIPTSPWQAWLDRDRLLQILPGFPSDGASVPRLLWPLCGPYQPKTFPGAFGHDGLYAAELVRQHEADRIFHDLLRRGGASRILAGAMYGAVWTCGWAVYRRHTPETIAAARQYCRIVTRQELGLAA